MMKVIDWKSFGELIKEKRAKKNLTQAELAKVVTNLSISKVTPEYSGTRAA